LAQVKKTAVREAILAAAWELFSEHGYNGSTLSMIAQAARVSTANLYVYFPSKLDIFYALYSPWMRERLAALGEEARQVVEPRDRLRLIIRALWRDIPAAANGFANNLIQALSGVAPEAAYDPGLLLWCETIVAAMIRDALPRRAAAVDIETLAHVMFMAFDGFAVNLHLQRGERCTDAAIELFCDFLLGRPARTVSS
jgi:AcrR family transcriptional regulator